MKKIIMTALAALLAAPCFAQYDEDAIYTSPNGKFTFDLVGHFGAGHHFVETNDFKPYSSTEFFMNVVKFGVYPVEHLGLEAGVDIQFNTFVSKETAFAQVDGLIKPVSFPALGFGDSFDHTSGTISVFGFGAPVMVKGFFGKFQIGVGAVASWNTSADTSAYLRKDNRELTYRENDAKVNPFSYGLMAMLGYGPLDVYFKYYPKSVRLFPEGGIDLSYMTVGIALGL